MSEYRLSTRLNENAHLEVATDNLNDMAQALVFFNLIDPNKAVEAPAPAADVPTGPADGTLDPTPTPLSEKLVKEARKARAKKEAPVVEEAAAEPVDPTPAPAADPSAPEIAPASSASSPAPAATPADAAEAVRGYGARHGIAAARELLQKFGFARTSDITPDKAGELAQAAAA